MGKAKIVMPTQITKIPFREVKEDQWFIDMDGDLCCKLDETKAYFSDGRLCVFGLSYGAIPYEDSPCVLVSVEIKVTYND